MELIRLLIFLYLCKPLIFRSLFLAKVNHVAIWMITCITNVGICLVSVVHTKRKPYCRKRTNLQVPRLKHSEACHVAPEFGLTSWTRHCKLFNIILLAQFLQWLSYWVHGKQGIWTGALFHGVSLYVCRFVASKYRLVCIPTFNFRLLKISARRTIALFLHSWPIGSVTQRRF